MLFGKLTQIYWLVCCSISQPGEIGWYVGWSVNLDRLVCWAVGQPEKLGRFVGRTVDPDRFSGIMVGQST